DLELLELCIAEETAHDREAVLGEERVELVEVGRVEHADFTGERTAGRAPRVVGHGPYLRAPRTQPVKPRGMERWRARSRGLVDGQAGWRVWVNTSTRRMRPSSSSSKVRHSGVRSGEPSTSTVSESSANASEPA